MSAPLTQVRDWLTGEDIPVRYITPGSETAEEQWDALRCIHLRLEGLDAEVEAMTQNVIPDRWDDPERDDGAFVSLLDWAVDQWFEDTWLLQRTSVWEFLGHDLYTESAA